MPRPAPQEPKLVNITINGVDIQAPEGELLVEAAKRADVDIPIFCYHKYMEPVGMCRMCLVEIGFKQPDGSVRNMPKPQAACTLPVSEGMVCYSETQQIIEDRRGVLEFLLINHPLDCPICDRGGECPLQNNTQFYGPSTSRYIEIKRHLPKSFPLSQHVTLDLERCIQCGRCVRFTDEVSGDSQLAFLFRGAQMQPRSFQLTDYASRFSGNVIEICPVGALTSRDYRFRARPWDIVTQKSVCNVCSNGCNVYVDGRDRQVIRVNGRENPKVNETWTCDKGKFTMGRPKRRIEQPMIRKDGMLQPATWPEAYDAVISKFKEGGVKAALGGSRLPNEDAYLFKRLMNGAFGVENLDHRYYRLQTESPAKKRLGATASQRSIEALEDTGLVFVFGSHLAEEQPIVYLRARKAWHQWKTPVIVAHPVQNDVEQFASVSMRYQSGTEYELLCGLLKAVCDLAPAGEPLRSALAECTPEWTERATGVSKIVLQNTAKAVLEAESMILLAGERAINHRDPERLIDGLINLAAVTGNATHPKGGFNLMLPDCNSHGALDLGLIPENDGLNTDSILNGCIRGEIESLYLLDSDLPDRHYDPLLAEEAARRAPFLVVQSSEWGYASEYADVLLPAKSLVEREGTLTNLEGRVQRFWQAFDCPHDAKEDWKIFADLLLRTTLQTPPFSAREIMTEIASSVPGYEGAQYQNLGAQGMLLSAQTPAKVELTPMAAPTFA